jgi:hypothetical protein
MAARLAEAGEDALVRVVTPTDGRARLSVDKLGALGESPTLAWLRGVCQAMLPQAAANAILIEAQRNVPIVASWGGGLLASVDGLRFVVPVQTINAGPSPKYFG